MNLIECKKLNIGYNEKVVCKNINFGIQSGEYWCIVGENGSGKSTLIKTILGLNKALKGKVEFSTDFNRKKIGYLPQSSEFQKDFPSTVREIVMTGFINQMGFRPFYTKKEREKAMSVMQSLHIDEFANKGYKELSGGQQQKVLLARAILATDELLVLDEPTNALDARSIKNFYQMIHKLNKEKNITVLMISHNLDKVIDHATHVIYLKDEPLFVGSKEDFVKTEYVKSLLKSEGEK